MSVIALNVYGRLELPDAPYMNFYYQKAKAAEKLQGFEKHYQATVHLLLATATSFFNALSYGGSAIAESALIAPLGVEDAKENFQEEGLKALASIISFVQGFFLTVGSLFVLDDVLSCIEMITPQNGGEEEGGDAGGAPPQVDGQALPHLLHMDRGDVQPHVDGVPAPVECWNQQQMELVMVHGAFQRFELNEIPEDIQDTVVVIRNSAQPAAAELPNLKLMLARLIFINDFQDEKDFEGVLEYITTEMQQVESDCQEQRDAFRAAKVVDLGDVNDARAVVSEQDAAFQISLQTDQFREEKEQWETLIGQAEKHLEQLEGQVDSLRCHEQRMRDLTTKKKFISTKKDLLHWVNRFEGRHPLSEVPSITTQAVTEADRQAIEQKACNLVEGASEERDGLIDKLDELETNRASTLAKISRLNQVKANWEAIKEYAVGLDEDKTPVDQAQLQPLLSLEDQQ